MLPKISIITPSFNQRDYVEQTIVSVLDQNYPNLEYIIIDGASTDYTVEIIQKYSPYITYWVSEPDRGQTDAINKGFAVATGDIINWLNSDDFLAPGALNQIANSFSNPKIKAVTSTVHNFIKDGAEWNEVTGNYKSNIEYITKSFNNQPGTFFLKSVWDRYFPLPIHLRYTMDQYLWFCFWLEHDIENFKVENYTTVFFRRHALSKTSRSLGDSIFNNLGKDFFNEHNLIFWSYFKDIDFLKAEVIASYFWDNYDYKSNCISFPSHLTTNNNKVNDYIFQLYLFQLLKEDYKHGFFRRLNKNLKYIKRDAFPQDEMRVLNKMRLSTVGPNTLKAYRSIYWKVKGSFNNF